VSTWTLCSIPDIRGALRKMRRVVKPGGRFIFIEHGRAPAARVRAWQDRLTPLWARVAQKPSPEETAIAYGRALYANMPTPCGD